MSHASAVDIREGRAISLYVRTRIITRRMLITATTLLVVSILCIVSYLLVREYRNTEQEATRSAFNLVQLIDREARNTVSLYDTALMSLISLFQSHALDSFPQPLQNTLLFHKASELPSNDGFYLLNALGEVIATSTPDIALGQNVTDKPWFKVHRELDSGEIFISRPFQNSGKDGDWSIRFSRRMSAPDGSFAGVAVAQMKLDYFTSLLRGLDVGPDGNISLFRTDGIMLVQYPAMPSITTGEDLSRHPNYMRLLNEGYGSFIAMSDTYKAPRLYNFSQVSNLPIVVVVGLSTEYIFSNWWHTALLIGTATLLLCLGMIWLTLLLRHELYLRQQAERSLAELASTDPLSGLANRRVLDKTLADEWRVAQRTGRPLSLLMIDIDHFKQFNDTYGHQIGDEAIRRVAKIINTHMRRPRDLATRYGGEEFAVVLADTDAAGARQLAEDIRASVDAMEPVLPGKQKLTVSLGACTCYAKPEDDVQVLLSMADKALYQAKKGGRNRVVAINETGLNAIKPAPGTL